MSEKTGIFDDGAWAVAWDYPIQSMIASSCPVAVDAVVVMWVATTSKSEHRSMKSMEIGIPAEKVSVEAAWRRHCGLHVEPRQNFGLVENY
jgi:hypothetical protein